MKSKILLFLLLLICSEAHGQFSSSRFRPGAKIGYNVSLFTKDVGAFDNPAPPYSDFKNSVRSAFTGGVTLDIEMAQRFTFGIELLYNSRGMNYRQENERVIIESETGSTKRAYNYFTYQLDYLELPLTVKYNFKPETSSKSILAYAGIAPSVPVNKKTKLSYPKSDPDHHNQKDDLLYVNSFMKSFLAGVQFGESTAERDLYIDLRGGYTLSRVFNRPLNDVAQNLDTRMLTFTASFGIKF
jgi:hypothetical protein